MPDSRIPPEPSTEKPDAPRRVIGDRYEVISVIGQGAVARTFLCQDLQKDRHVVVKELLFAHISDWKQLELFEREARMLSRLEHPSIPRVFDYFQGDDEGATYYIVQEYIEAPSLLERMEAGPMLGQAEIREIADGLLHVLEYLHGRAPPVIHRDIKPANVLLRPDGSPALIDFGGIRAAWQLPGSPGATVVGTFGYMAPEQVSGQAGPKSDLYSLGATLLHLSTGHPPSDFSFDTGRIEVPDDLPIDERLASLIEALLRPAPRDRPASAQAARQLLTTPVQPADGQTLSRRSEARMTSGMPVRPEQSALPAIPLFASLPVTAPTELTLFGVSGEPRLVDMGSEPRDTKGDFKDVYRNLMHPLFPARRAWGDTEQVLWLGFSGVASVFSLGVVPAFYALSFRNRRKRLGDLFRNGLFTVGTIRSIVGADAAVHATIKYDFQVDGSIYRGYMQVAAEMTRYWSVSDPVAVLYDASDPSRSCIVYR